MSKKKNHIWINFGLQKNVHKELTNKSGKIFNKNKK